MMNDLSYLSMMGAKKQQNNSQPTVDMAATQYSSPVKLMAKFVNDRGWGQPDVSGMYDWMGNALTNQPVAQVQTQVKNNNQPSEWDAYSMLIQKLFGNKTSSHDSYGGGGYGR